VPTKGSIIALRRGRVAVAAAVASLGSVHLSLAQDNWIAGDGNWSVASNWSPANVPGPGDDVYITPDDGVNRTITYDYTGSPITLSSLTVDLTNAVGTASNVLSMSANTLMAGIEDVGTGGSFNQSGGLNAISGDLGITGLHALSGSGSLAAYREDLGDVSSGAAGTFDQSGGTNTTNLLFFDEPYFESYASNDSYTLSGTGTLAVIGAGTVGDAFFLDGGTFTQCGSTLLAVTGNEDMGDLGTANYNQSGGTNIISGFLYVGFNGPCSYTLSGSGSLIVTGDEYVGNGPGSFRQSGGRNIINGGNSLFVGYNAPNASYMLSCTGSLSVTGNEYIGSGPQSSGTFNQSGGTNTTSELDLGYDSASTGAYTLTGGTATTQGGVYVGGSSAGPGGMGIFSVSDCGQLSVAGTITVYNTGRLNINGGSVIAGSISLTGTNATLETQLGGYTPGVDYDFLTVTGTASLGGILAALNQNLVHEEPLGPIRTAAEIIMPVFVCSQEPFATQSQKSRRG
jgi:hypothetical protein